MILITRVAVSFTVIYSFRLVTDLDTTSGNGGAFLPVFILIFGS
ncbi:Putative uncharacterized protein [Moritella viscosa]|nr:Putative uncharacterized protein [Moritella viscosa]